ncbi:MAG: hypothetical protein IKZ81_05645 [Clostridia bacterium]|nr:hypothetical protein [Clostridia bacterium]MBR5769499.1 hypothetical protein [Clostridia bacterium]MBR5942810.1 hypothetical protein [Clostridia bacterium]
MKKLVNWFKQYGYYYKYVFITLFLAAVVLTIGLVSCLSKKDYDLKVILSGDFIIYDSEIYAYENMLAELIDDWNGDGEVNVQVMGLSTNAGNAQLNYSYSQRFQAEVMTGEVLLFVTDAGKYDLLNEAGGVADVSSLLPEGYPESTYFSFTGSAFAQKVAAEYKRLCGNYDPPTTMPDGLRLYMRVAPDDAADNPEYTENYKRVQELFRRIVNE